MPSKTATKSPAEMTTTVECDCYWRETTRTYQTAQRVGKTSAATLAKHQARMEAISARKAELAAAAQAPVITLHLTSNQLVSRVDMVINGAAHSASLHGDKHMSRARALALEIKQTLKVSPAAAVIALATHARMAA